MYADVQHLGPLRVSAPFAGTVLQYNPFFQRYHYNNHDKKPKDVCCSSGHCDWYYDVRPIPNCYIWSPFKPGIFSIYLKFCKTDELKSIGQTFAVLNIQ